LRVTRTAAAEADRVRKANPAAWARHAETINSLIADFDYENGGLGTLDAEEANAIRFLITGMVSEALPDGEERAGMANLRVKLGLL
jgi:hypothetical protein